MKKMFTWMQTLLSEGLSKDKSVLEVPVPLIPSYLLKTQKKAPETTRF